MTNLVAYTIEIYSLTVLETTSLKCVLWGSNQGVGRAMLPPRALD